MRAKNFLWGLLCLMVVLVPLSSVSEEIDDDLAPSKITGAEVQALLKPGMTSDDLFKDLQTTPARVRQNRFHWQLADGSIWTNVVPTERGLRIVGWIIESDSLNTKGGELEEFDRLFTEFYRNPDPARVPRILELAALFKMFDEEHNRKSMSSFLSAVFRANPDQVAGWARLPGLSPAQHQVIYAAIAQAKLKQSKDLLRTILANDEPNKVFIEQLLKAEPEDILERAIDEPMDLDALWAGFYATGDGRYVERICSVFSWNVDGLDQSSEKWRINGAAAWSVGANARRHPIVAQVCKDNAHNADERAKPIYERILAELQRERARIELSQWRIFRNSLQFFITPPRRCSLPFRGGCRFPGRLLRR